MGAKPETIGGGSAKGVSDDFSNLLHQALNGFNLPNYGAQQTSSDNLGRADPMGSTMSIGNALSTLLAGGSNLADSAKTLGAQARTRGVDDIRARYSLGGTGYGTPASVGESNFTSQFDPALAGQVGGLQMDGITKALGFLFPALQEAYGIGTPQAQTVMKPSGFTNFVSGLSQLGGAAAQFFPGSSANKGPPAGGTPSLSTTQLGQASRYNFDGSHTDKLNPGAASSWMSGFGNGRDSFGTPWWAN